MIAIKNLKESLPCFHRGTVWLVGAGPGHPGLLSVLALHGMQQADIVLHDALISQAILDLIPASTLVENTGKRAGLLGSGKKAQEAISARLVVLARQGYRVLRLKGGDPFVFARGAEEAMALAYAGVRFVIVPGVTAGLGGLAMAGIPATCRFTNSVITLLTGHDDSQINWSALVQSNAVLVFYMGAARLQSIISNLLAHAINPETPIAVVAHASMESQNVTVATLSTIAMVLDLQKLPTPAIVAVGKVVEYSSLFKSAMENILSGGICPDI